MSKLASAVMADGDRAFAAALSGARVVLVGPARTLVGAGRGPEIDRYDVVVRLNEALVGSGWDPAPLASDVGRRTDVCYSNQVVLRHELLGDEMHRRRYLQRCAANGLRFAVCANNSLGFDASGAARETCPPPDRQVPAAASAWMADIGARLRVAHGASLVLHRWLDGHWARTGFVALFDLLTFDIDCLHVTGMTFYHGGGHVLASERAVLHPRHNRDGSSSISPSGKGHDSYLELQAMRWLCRCFPRQLRVDHELGRLLR